jgi:hypothetical protein
MAHRETSLAGSFSSSLKKTMSFLQNLRHQASKSAQSRQQGQGGLWKGARPSQPNPGSESGIVWPGPQLNLKNNRNEERSKGACEERSTKHCTGFTKNIKHAYVVRVVVLGF